MIHGVYLHGFASSPLTKKGIALGERLRRDLGTTLRSWSIPDLEGPSFRAMTMDGILARAEAAVVALPADGAPVLICGSSLGGYTAAQLLATGRLPRAVAAVLIAPAFGFIDRWHQILGPDGEAQWLAVGERTFWHHGRERDEMLGADFLRSCQQLPSMPGDPRIPVTVIHGRQDETVDHRASIAWVKAHPEVELLLVQGDHRLTDDRHEDLIAWAARDLVTRFCSSL
jgi:pimeloyl-ACP methyl ester carboxylesterase